MIENARKDTHKKKLDMTMIRNPIPVFINISY